MKKPSRSCALTMATFALLSLPIHQTPAIADARDPVCGSVVTLRVTNLTDKGATVSWEDYPGFLWSYRFLYTDYREQKFAQIPSKADISGTDTHTTEVTLSSTGGKTGAYMQVWGKRPGCYIYSGPSHESYVYFPESPKIRTPPSAPRNIRLTVAATKVTVSWEYPESDGGLPIVTYTATDTQTKKSCTTDRGTCTITGLAPSSSVTVVVSATNSVGSGPKSLQVRRTTLKSTVQKPIKPVVPPVLPVEPKPAVPVS